jgi:hypothetical protein
MENPKSKPVNPKKEEVDPQAVNKKIAERLLKFNKEMHKEKDGGGTDKK